MEVLKIHHSFRQYEHTRFVLVIAVSKMPDLNSQYRGSEVNYDERV